MKLTGVIISFLVVSLVGDVNSQTVSNVAGIPGVQGNANGPASSATFNNPYGIALDPQGNVFVADRFAHTIRKITPAGIVSSFAGTGSPGGADGQGASASFNEPWAVACDTLGNVYVADTKNYKIRKITPSGNVTTFAGTGTFGVTNGLSNVAQFGFPSGIAVTKDGQLVYVADRMTNVIRKIENDSVITFVGTVFSPGANDGQGLSAKFDHPNGIALDPSGNLLVADEYNNKIRKITPSGMVTTFAGNGSPGGVNGSALSASFNAPWGVCADQQGNVYVGDANNYTIRKISAGNVSVYAGQNGVAGMVNGPALQSSFTGVSALWYQYADNSVYVCDPYSQLVRKVAGESITLNVSNGTTSYCIGAPVSLVASPTGYSNYVFYNGGIILGTSSNGTLTISSLPQGTHNITCTATNSQGQTIGSNTIIITITSSLQVSISASGSTTICQGQSVTLTASPSGSYLWSNGATAAFIQVNNAGSYSVTVTNAQGCSGQSQSVSVTTLQAPDASVSSSSGGAVCAGDSVQLSAGNAATYLWSNGQTSQNIYVTTPGNYTVMVSSGAGCSAISLPVTVNFLAPTFSTVSPGGNVLLASGSSLTLTANNGLAWEWSTGEVTQSITVNSAGDYVVTVTDTAGCKSAPDTARITLIDPSTIVTVTGSSSFCEGDSLRLSSAFADGNQWYYNSSPLTGATTQDFYAKLDGTYHVEYIPSSGPAIVSDPVNVTVYQRPGPASISTDSVCSGDVVILNIQPESGISYSWYNSQAGGTPLGTGASLMTPPLSFSTSFFVESVNANGCRGWQRTEVIAYVYNAPVVEIQHTEPTLFQGAYEVHFSVTGDPLTSYFWDFGDPGSPDNNANTPDPFHVYTQPGDYTITLDVTDLAGCASSFNKIVAVVMKNNLFVPTGFSPNDDGNNDLFRVRGNNISYYDMRIYSQWGENIWRSPKETTGWDGTINGQKTPPGSYAYVIEVVFDNGNKELLRGNINLIR